MPEQESRPAEQRTPARQHEGPQAKMELETLLQRLELQSDQFHRELPRAERALVGTDPGRRLALPRAWPRGAALPRSGLHAEIP
jgi:hypothetical protein